MRARGLVVGLLAFGTAFGALSCAGGNPPDLAEESAPDSVAEVDKVALRIEGMT